MGCNTNLSHRNQRGRPTRVPVDPFLDISLNTASQCAEEWFDLCDRLLALEKSNHAQEDIGAALGRSQSTVSRMTKAAAWPPGIRARILLCSVKFPVKTLMRLARTTWRDQGKVSSDGRRRVLKSRMTLRAAVDLIIEGKSPFRKATKSASARARRMEEIANEERSARQAQKAELERLQDENRRLREEISLDKYSDALRRCAKLEAEVVRLSTVRNEESTPKAKSPDLERADAATAAALGVGPNDVDTLDWPKGLMLIRARNGDVLDGLREKLNWLPMIQPRNGRIICSSCRSMVGQT